MSNIFRKKAFDKMRSPEDLNDYMKVTNPPVWFILTAVILLLAGAIFWGTTAKLETKAHTVLVSESGETFCYVSEKYIACITPGMTVRVGQEVLAVCDIGEGTLAPDALTDYERTLAGLENGEGVYRLTLSGAIAEGHYEADVVLDVISPLSYLFSSSM